MNNSKRRLGYIPDLPDFRDHAFAIAVPIPLPVRVDLRWLFPPLYDQGNEGSCTGNGIAALFDAILKKQGKPFITPSRQFIYYNERVIENSVSSDAGAMIRDGIKSVVKLGVCPETLWPYEMSNMATRPTVDCYVEAKRHQILNYRRISPNLNSMLYCLAYGYPFVFGFSVYESFMSDAVANTGIVPMPVMNEAMVGGHCVVALGYDQTKRTVLCRNSWGQVWGQEGHFELPFDYISNPDMADDRWRINLVESETESAPLGG